MSFPTVIIYSFSDCQSSVLAEGIIAKSAGNSINSSSGGKGSIDDSIQTFVWNVETKYYTAQVEICAFRNDARHLDQNVRNKLQSMEAVILQFDSNDRATFDAALKLFESMDLCPPVQLLVCDNCSQENGKVRKIEVQEWCIKNGFELVELNPSELSDSEEDFGETTGMKRIVQALHAHTWSNLKLKDKPESASRFDCLLQSASRDESDETVRFDESLEKSVKNVTQEEASSIEKEVQNSMQLLEDDESFESLFEKFHLMKEKASNMPFSERKEYAEQVAIAFWKAIGGDKNEIEGLDGDN